MFVKGVVMDAMTGKLLEAKVVLTNLMNNRIEDSCTSDPLTGEFLMVLHPGTEYAFNISKKGYLFYSKNINLKDSVAKHVQQSFKLSPYKRGEQIVLNNIFFDFNSARLKAASQTELSNLLNMLKENKTLRLLISGHTDNVGKDSYNEKLSTERAFAVYSFLIQNGIDKSRLEYKGFGRSKPIASNASDEGRRINRRTEITVL
jgi:outer membrane protein OmpA-like peptidoglycan-associated protein